MNLAFDAWWREEGSALAPLPGEDQEQHARRIAEIAWGNGEYVASRQLRETLRDRFAMAAIAGMLPNPDIYFADDAKMAGGAYHLADAMMHQRALCKHGNGPECGACQQEGGAS